MDLKCPTRVLGAANQLADLLIGRRLAGEVERVWTDAPEAKRRSHASMAGAGGAVRRETTVRPRKRFDRRAGVLQALAKQLCGYPQGLRGLRA
jgi:hypothetical protein